MKNQPNRELLFSVTKNDLEITHFRAGGPGGQKQNKTSSAARVKHPESGAVGEARDSRSQHQNTIAAWHRMLETDTFKLWHQKKCAELLLDKAEEERRHRKLVADVERSMCDSNLLIEAKDEDGNWTPFDQDAAEASTDRPTQG